jgi:hypothetical protein
VRAPIATLFAVLLPALAAAQQWNSPGALALADRAIERRAGAAADTTLHDYRAVAHGFLFFLGAFGEGLSEPPRLIKADQLELEVYWKAPGASKQRIVGWRDRADLPTDIVYHRDHLGIVMNAFGRTIQIGDGDEVQGVPHPFAPGGPLLYDYAAGDTITVTLPERDIRVVAVRVRPKDFQAARLVGTAYLDVTTGDLVRLAFDFTPAAYRDPSLEDVSVVLDNALYEDRWWLPQHQAIEIRRHATVLDLPARGVIRGRWEVDGYVFNTGLSTSWFNGPEISAAPKAQRDSFPWPNSLGDALQLVAEPVRRNDLAAVRAEVARVAGRHMLSGWRPSGLAIDGLSDLAHVNRVQGVVLGMGGVWRPRRVEARARASYGFADHQLDGAVSGRVPLGTRWVSGRVYREVRDIGDVPVVAPVINSLAAQELGDDYGDYVRTTGAELELAGNLSHDVRWRVTAGREHLASLAIRATPATGRFRPNPALGGTTLDRLTLGVAKAGEGFAMLRDRAYDVALEGGRVDGGSTYLRLFGAGHLLLPLGRTRVLARAQGGIASANLPVHRAFVLGGRGSLLGDSFRAWGGRAAALLHLEWRVPVPCPSLPLGPMARTPRHVVLAPYVATGWADRAVSGTPWLDTPGVRVTTGIGLEWLGVFRLEAGYGLESRRARFAFDVTREFWGVL